MPLFCTRACKEEGMLATIAGCQFEVDRGPDWLLVRVRKLEEDPVAASDFAERLWQLLRTALHLPADAGAGSGRATDQQPDRPVDPVAPSGSRSTTASCGCAACRRRTARCCKPVPWTTASGPTTAESRRSWVRPTRVGPSKRERPLSVLERRYSGSSRLPLRWRFLGRRRCAGSPPGPSASESRCRRCPAG